MNQKVRRPADCRRVRYEPVAEAVAAAQANLDERFVAPANGFHVGSLGHEEHFGRRNWAIDFREKRLNLRDVIRGFNDELELIWVAVNPLAEDRRLKPQRFMALAPAREKSRLRPASNC